MAKIPKYFYFRVHAGRTSIELEDASDIDVVEVVRRKDCRWSEWYTAVNGKRYGYCMAYGASARTEMDYCSRGEREDGEQSETD